MSGYEHDHEHGHFMPHSHPHRHQGEAPTEAHERSGMGAHHHKQAPTPDTTEVTLRAALDAIPTVALSYPKGPKYIEHDEDCAFAYGNTTYNCHCFVRLSAVRDALQQPAVQLEGVEYVHDAPCPQAGTPHMHRVAVQPEGGPE